MSRKRNTFSKAVKHLKSSKIEEKLQTLNEIPTMNTSGLYDLVPGALSRTEIDNTTWAFSNYTVENNLYLPLPDIINKIN